jgi:uncharacterized RDD family membrane protein YckC
VSGDREYGGWLPPSGDRPTTDPFGRELPSAERAPEAPPEPSAWGPGPSAAGETADYGSRMLAALTDFFVRLAFVLAGAALGALGLLSDTDTGETTIVVGAAVGAFVALFYAPIMISRTGGQTVGHRAAGTRILRTDGSTLGFGIAFVREALVKGILFEGIGAYILLIPPLLNYLWPLWDKDNEALHDKMCSTRVVVDR